MQRKERDPSRRAPDAPQGCAGCLLCKGLKRQKGAFPRRTLQPQPGTAARLFVA